MFERWFIHHRFPKHIDALASNWKKVPLKNLVTISSGKKLSGEAAIDGKYPFFTGSKAVQKINEYSFDQKAILLSTSANIFVKYYSGKFDARTTTLVLSAKANNILWLFEFLSHYCFLLLQRTNGVGIKGLGIDEVKNFEISLPPDNLLNLFNKFAEPMQKHIDSLSKQIDTFQVVKKELIERIYSQNLEIG